MTTEMVERTEDWTRCVCGNQPHLDGFICTDADGTNREGEYGPTTEWDGDSFACVTCGRIIGYTSAAVIGQISLAQVQSYVS